MMSEHTDPEEIAVPLFEEQASIAKRRIVTGKVKVSTVTHEHEQLIEEMLDREQVEIERTPIDKRIDVMPRVREEGDTTVIPIVEEILVIERRLVLKEEVRVRRVRSKESHQERVVLRRQEAVISRDPAESLAAHSSKAEEAVKTETEK
jgi:stress response protein YsnF